MSSGEDEHASITPAGRARAIAIGVGAVLLAVGAVLLFWPGRFGVPSIAVTPHGRFTNGLGQVLYKVAVTNRSVDQFEFIVTRYQHFKFKVGGDVTNMMTATNFVLKPDAGSEGVVDAPWPAGDSWVSVLYRRDRGRREMYLRSFGYRLGWCKMYGPWEELRRFPLESQAKP